jgi:hypothetical protein
LKLRCWQFCWQSKTQKILPLSKIPLIVAVTNALSCSTSPAAVRPNPLTTAPVPFRKKRARHELHFKCRMIGALSACGSAPVVTLRLRSRRLSASASLSRSPNRRPKLDMSHHFLVTSFYAWQTARMLRVVKLKNFQSNSSASLGFEAKVWTVADTATRPCVKPEIGVLPNRDDNFVWVQHFISC